MIYKINIPIKELSEDNKYSYVFYTNLKIQAVYANSMLKANYNKEETTNEYNDVEEIGIIKKMIEEKKKSSSEEEKTQKQKKHKGKSKKAKKNQSLKINKKIEATLNKKK